MTVPGSISGSSSVLDMVELDTAAVEVLLPDAEEEVRPSLFATDVKVGVGSISGDSVSFGAPVTAAVPVASDSRLVVL